MKTCSKCKCSKEPAAFNKDAKKLDGLRYECRSCQAKQTISDSARRKERMNKKKFDQVYRGLSVQAKKVYDAIPVNSTCSPNQIANELHRMGIPLSDPRVITGCLNSLVADGLVVESSNLMFRREAIRQAADANEVKNVPVIHCKEPEMSEPISIQTPPKTGSAIDLLGQFAVRLRAISDQVNTGLRGLANEAEIIAMDIAGQAEKNEVETAKMRQLQALLKSLG